MSSVPAYLPADFNFLLWSQIKRVSFELRHLWRNPSLRSHLKLTKSRRYELMKEDRIRAIDLLGLLHT